jgi:peptide-methionine (S)-S-oxide reductase
MKKLIVLTTFVTLLLNGSCTESDKKNKHMCVEKNISGIDTATFGAGCFWCTEAVFRELKGVIKVIPGYAGGHVNNPSYEDVCTGTTGHAEVCQIIFDADTISYDELLEIFFLIHDPTSLNKQGHDEGTQYRSVIFYHSNQQQDEALEYMAMLKNSGSYNKPLVTEIAEISNFSKAENYHFNYYNLNKQASYCRVVILPKVEKFKTVFTDKLKKSEK